MLHLDKLDIYILPVTPFAQNCSIVQCKNTFETAIIDPGGEIQSIMHFIQSKKNMQVKYILLTHGHLDHCGQAMALANQLNIPIYGPHKEDKFWLDQLEEQSLRYSSTYGFEITKNFLPHYWVQEGEQIILGENTIDIMHIPGHTPGHVVYYIKEQKIAWVGDVIFKHGVGRGDFPRGNSQQLIHNIVHKLLPLGDDYAFVCGHGETSTFGHERRHNPHVLGYLNSSS